MNGRPGTDAATPPQIDQIEETRPVIDRVAMERVRERAERALFGHAEPARLGRYELGAPIAGGGMGVVYGAYDPELDRRVALKVLHPRRSHDDRSHGRLITEARALAKLDHPNVVKVHDVLSIEGQIVIVMELVEGQTLEAWQATPRSWQAVVAVYGQAAEGLVAAHSVEVVHRDFKPSNAIIGVDGRVRVLDFGLARFTRGDGEPPSTERGAPLPTRLTQTGDIVGTLGYSSPEQLRGDPVTAAADQFSFCVSLHQAVEGVAPFSGATAPERLANIEAGVIALAADGRVTPTWLRATIARGLSFDPNRRYPTMAALLAELRRLRGWRRWRTAALITGIAAVSGLTTAGVRGGDAPADECDGGKALIASVWNPTQRATLLRVLHGIGAPYAREIEDRVVSDLDRYSLDWTDAHRSTCHDHRLGKTSDLWDRRMTCLSERLGDLQAAVAVVAHTDLESLAHVMDVIAKIPSVARCSDRVQLQAEAEPPDTPERRSAVSAARAQISTAEALSRSGRSAAARAAATQAVSLARATGYSPVQVEAALAEGRIFMSQGELAAAATPLALARTEALKQRMLPAAVEAAARMIYAEGMRAPSLANLERELAYALPLSTARECDHFARPLLLNNVGAVYQALGQRTEALKYFAEAKSTLSSYAPVDLELSVIDRNLAMLTPGVEKRTSLGAATWQRLRDALGHENPSTLDALVAYAEYLPDPAEAYRLMATAADDYHKFHPTMRWQAAVADMSRAFLAGELADRSRAITDYTAAIQATGGSEDPDLVIWNRLARGELALLQGTPDQAIRELTAVRDARLASPTWYERAEGVRATVGLGLAEAAHGRNAAAIHHLEVAITELPEFIAMNEEVKFRRSHARAQRALAELLRREGRDPERAATLERAAETFYRGASPKAYGWLLDRGPISTPAR